MTEPNLYTLQQPTGMYGLHKYKDGEVVICRQHHSGDWQQTRHPSAEELAHFQAHGVPFGQKPKRVWEHNYVTVEADTCEGWPGGFSERAAR